MTRVIALAHVPLAQLLEEALRSAIVIGCALTLIFAAAATPF